MATQKNDLISGKIGNVIYYVRNGKQFLRSHKAKINQSDCTKEASGNFGMAASLSRGLRGSIEDQLPVKQSASMRNRLTGKMFQSLNDCWNNEDNQFNYQEGSFSKSEGFEFDKEHALQDYLLKMPVTVEEKGKLDVQFPKISGIDDINFPEQAYRCTITVAVSTFDLETGRISSDRQRGSLTLLKGESILEATTLPLISLQD